MNTQHSPLVGGDTYGDVMKSFQTPSDRKKRRKPLAVLDEVGVSKPKHQHRNRRSQRKALDSTSTVEHPDPPRTDLLSRPEGRQTMARSTAKSALRQIHLQEVSKTRTTPLTKLHEARQKRVADMSQSSPQWSQTVSMTRTRSGRVSRKPARRVPE
ncbi:hypothetical protein MMC19_006564 [Ptychographa xylographoides]|nr:hypothetical protein [Ptychographa xylographoides]